MTQSEVNKIITEKVLKECWSIHWDAEFTNLDFSQWKHYGPLLEKIKASDWFGDFLDWFIKRNYLDEVTLDNALMVFFDVLTCIRCDDRHGSHAIAEFVKDKEVKR